MFLVYKGDGAGSVTSPGTLNVVQGRVISKIPAEIGSLIGLPGLVAYVHISWLG